MSTIIQSVMLAVYTEGMLLCYNGEWHHIKMKWTDDQDITIAHKTLLYMPFLERKTCLTWGQISGLLKKQFWAHWNWCKWPVPTVRLFFLKSWLLTVDACCFNSVSVESAMKNNCMRARRCRARVKTSKTTIFDEHLILQNKQK